MKIRRIFLFIFFISSCDPDPLQEWKKLKESSSVFVLVVYCEKHNDLTIQVECEEVRALGKSEIEAILSRQLDLGAKKVIVPREKGREIQMAIRAHVPWAIRYGEIWNSIVILE